MPQSAASINGLRNRFQKKNLVFWLRLLPIPDWLRLRIDFIYYYRKYLFFNQNTRFTLIKMRKLSMTIGWFQIEFCSTLWCWWTRSRHWQKSLVAEWWTYRRNSRLSLSWWHGAWSRLGSNQPVWRLIFKTWYDWWCWLSLYPWCLVPCTGMCGPSSVLNVGIAPWKCSTR